MSDFHIPNLSFDSATIKGSLIPDTDNAYDIGSATYKIRDMYVSDNSLWVGDSHKVSISGGKMKFRKRKTSSLPAAISNAGGNSNSAIAHAGVANLSSMKLKHWKNYMRSLSGQGNATVQDIFRDNDDDYEEESAADNWLLNGSNSYNNIGNVGIGTTEPGVILDVNGTKTAYTGQLRIQDSASQATGVGGRLTLTGYWSDTAIVGNAPYIEAYKESSVNTEYGYALAFGTRDNGVALSEKMRISGSGNVGIGIDNPIDKLQIDGGNLYLTQSNTATTFNNTDTGIYMGGDNDGTQNKLLLLAEATGSWAKQKFHICLNSSNNNDLVTVSDAKLTVQYDGSVGIGTDSPVAKLHIEAGEMYISNGNHGVMFAPYEGWFFRNKTANMSGYLDCMRIDNAGNVGIGDTSPSYKLDVNGDINFTGTLYQNGSVFSSGGGSGFNDLTETLTGQYGTVQTTASNGNGTWQGYSIAGRYAFMSESNSNVGLYNDIDNKWITYFARASATSGSLNFYVGQSDIQMTISSAAAVRIGDTTGFITGQSDFQANNSFLAGKGYLDVPWVCSGGIENYDEKGTGGTGMIFGSDRYTSSHDLITFMTAGVNRLQIDSSGLIINELGDIEFQRTDGSTACLLSSNNEGLTISESRGAQSSIATFGGDGHTFSIAGNKYLDITSAGTELCSGQSATGDLYATASGVNQLCFGWDYNNLYRHAIKTVHNSGGGHGNNMSFWLWNNNDTSTTIGSNKVFELTMEDNGRANIYGNLEISGYYGRTAFNKGYLCGAQQTVGQTAAKTNPIYVIGANYEPNETTLGSMYGIGYAQNTSFLPNNGTWGMYVTQAGNVGSFLAGSTGGNSFVMGNFGIGTNTPGVKLDVNGDIRTGNRKKLILSRGGTTQDPYIQSFAGKDLSFFTVAAERMRITEGGNVGIGTTSPNEKLQVVGDIRFGANSKLVLDQSSWQSCGNIELTSGSGTFGFHGTGAGTLGIYVDGNIRTDGIVYINGSQGIKTPTGNYGTIQCSGGGNGGWEGWGIDGKWVFMSTGDDCGLYNDVDNHWIQLYNRSRKDNRMYANGQEKFRLDNGGRSHFLNTGNHNDYLTSWTTDNGKGQMAWRWNASGGGSSDYNLDLYMDNNSGNNHKVGYLENSGSGSWRLNDFTGQHRCIPQNNTNSSMYGLIVYSTGKYMNIDNNLKPTIIDSLPICELCTIENDPRVFGVISDEADDNKDRKVGYGIFGTYQDKTNKNEKRIHINGVGEGAMWVCNKNGNILNGSYIISSAVSGYGMKQESNELLNSTVAKITCDCNFNLNPIVKQKVKVIENIKTLKRQKKIDYQETKMEIQLDENTNQYREVEITKTYSKIETEQIPIYNSEGIQLLDNKGEPRTFEVEVMEEYQVIETDLDFDENGDIQYEDDLDDNGHQQMEYEYDTRFLNSDGSIISSEEYKNKKENGENVYISCFIGCTYHCG